MAYVNGIFQGMLNHLKRIATVRFHDFSTKNGGWETLNAIGQQMDNPFSNTYNPRGQTNNMKDIAELKNQVGKIMDFMGKFSESGKLPPSTVPNPKSNFESAKIVAIRSGRVFNEVPKKVQKKAQVAQEEEDEVGISKNDLEADPAISKVEAKLFQKSKKEESDQAILEVFKKVQVNIPLIDCITQVPKYAKFLKELCTTRRQTREKEVVKMSETVSVVLQRKLPPKLKDPGSFSISCVIGDTTFDSVILDLGASINIMPYNLYASMDLGELKKDNVIIKLADRSNKYPKGYVEDVLVRVNHLIFPTDFYIIDMEDSPSNSTPILLGRPFMRTARTKIDVHAGALTMEFDGEVIGFNIFEAMRYPLSELKPCYSIDIVDSLAQNFLNSKIDDKLEYTISQGVGYNADGTNVSNAELEEIWDNVVLETVAALKGLRIRSDLTLSLPISTNKLLPSVEQAPKLELKALPNHLKYVYLGESETFPAIVSSKLDNEQEKRLVEVLKKYKTAIGWTLADIKGISLTTCVHPILLEDGAKPTREAQRRLYQPMMKVVQDEVIKLLDCGVIYPISDSKWVSLVQVVPNKFEVTVVKNAENELVPQRVVTGHRVCIDYRKLNATTRKDHFPLPFIDQMLERAVQIKSEKTGEEFKVNGHRLKPYYEAFKEYNVEEVPLQDTPFT
ncbi:PREDICTED: uncharacterized protein LOC101292944 [Fragaria vesca subsp. vesca]